MKRFQRLVSSQSDDRASSIVALALASVRLKSKPEVVALFLPRIFFFLIISLNSLEIQTTGTGTWGFTRNLGTLDDLLKVIHSTP